MQSKEQREQLESRVQGIFRLVGFEIITDTSGSASFDFFAYKKTPISSFVRQNYLVKVLIDLDVFRKQHGIELQILSDLFSATPLLVSETSGGEDMHDNTVYYRHKIPSVNTTTLKNLLVHSEKLYQYSVRGGYLIKISGQKLKDLREKHGLTQEQLAEILNISLKTLQRYEKDITDPNIENAQKIASYFNDTSIFEQIVISPKKEQGQVGTHQQALTNVDIPPEMTKPKTKLQNIITFRLDQLGYVSLWFRSIPFDGFVLLRKYVKKGKDTNKIMIDKNVCGTNIPILSGTIPSVHKKIIEKVHTSTKLSHASTKKNLWVAQDNEQIKELKKCIHKTLLNDLRIISIEELESLENKQLKEILLKSQ